MLKTRSLVLLSVCSVLAFSATACGPNGSGGDGDACTGSETRCDGDEFQTCSGGEFEANETCAGSTVCDPSVGCADCSPVGGTFCSGDAVVACGTDGTTGSNLETCEPGTCSNGACGNPGDSCQAQGVELIYTVTIDNRLLSFDPNKIGGAADPFTTIGTLNCPAGRAFGGGQATPFSMSVDRDAVAWVLYSSGEIFHVSTQDASCSATSFAVGQKGFELFGMGFVTDSAGGQTETLFIAGGNASTSSSQDLGKIDTSNMSVSELGSLPNHQFGPELTGTGDSKLYGYYPGSSSYVAEMDKANASSIRTLPLSGLPTAPTAWAFAHYGGRVYIFITTGNAGNRTSRVLELDLSGNSPETVIIPDSAPVIVGAGVSTCAPIVID